MANGLTGTDERSDARSGPPAGARPFLLVHGAWHGPWCWHEHWTGYFDDAGYRVDAIQLASHDRPGSRHRIWSTIRDHVAEVRARLAELGPDTVLVGHSMGGLVVQRALEGMDESQAAGAVLLASVPRWGAAAAVLRLIRREPLAILRALTAINLRHLVETEARTRQAFFTPDTPDEVVDSTLRRLQNESFRAFLSLILRPPRPSRVRIPVHVVAAEVDWFFTRAEQRKLAAAYGTTLRVVPGGHDLMLDTSWSQSADEVLRWAAGLDHSDVV